MKAQWSPKPTPTSQANSSGLAVKAHRAERLAECSDLPTPQKTRPIKSSAIVLLAEAWKTAPIRKDVPAIIIELRQQLASSDQPPLETMQERKSIKAEKQLASFSRLPFTTPMLRKVRSRNRRKSARKVHNGGVGLKSVVVVLAVKAAVSVLRKKPTTELLHRLHTT